MISRIGAREWSNEHQTFRARVQDFITIDNTFPDGRRPTNPFEYLQQAANDADKLIAEAAAANVSIRAVGSAWALTDITITDGWLLNTATLNGCFEMAEHLFDASFPAERRPLVTFPQCGKALAELNRYLELRENRDAIPRALKTSGIGAGQTVAGAVLGNTHGSAVRFGSIPDYVIGMHIATGNGEPIWLERASEPVMSQEFVDKLGAKLVRDDALFDAAIVSFGAFGIVTALALEVDPIYQLKFEPVRTLRRNEVESRLAEIAQIAVGDESAPYHYEFIFNPYDKDEKWLTAEAYRVPFEPGQPIPEPLWKPYVGDGYTLSAGMPAKLLDFPLIPAGWKAKFQFNTYKDQAILGDVRSTPGGCFTATATHFINLTETAICVSISDLPRVYEIARGVVKDQGLPCISQNRIVHPTRALVGFTRHAPKSVVMEFGLKPGNKHVRFETELFARFRAANIPFTCHWSKNAGLTRELIDHMYGASTIQAWLDARSQLFGGNSQLMKAFDNDHLRRCGLVG